MKLRRRGCTPVGIEKNGNWILKLNVTNALGEKGDLLQIPKDEGIYENIQFRAQWELEECDFLSHELKKLRSDGFRTDGTLLDIGANAGWITLQTLRLAKTKPRVILVEPIQRHLDAIQFNMKRIEVEYEIVPFALSTTNGTATIFTEDFNHGNSSLDKSVVSTKGAMETEINLKRTVDFATEFLSEDEVFILKCDIQGRDAEVLSQLPDSVWERTRAAVVEIWAVDSIDSVDVEKCFQLWEKFPYISWSFYQPKQLTFSKISEFWFSGTKETRNLFLHR